PAGNDRGPLYMDQVLAALHQGNPERLPITLRFARIGEAVSLVIGFPPELKALVRSQLYSQYPDCRLQEIPDAAVTAAPGTRRWTAHLMLSHDLFPLKRYPQFEDTLNRQTADPVTAILSTLTAN